MVIEPQTEDAGTRRVWSDSKGRMWVSEWKPGNLSVYDPAAKAGQVCKLPGDEPQAYAVYVDDKDKVWVTDFAANAIRELRPRDARRSRASRATEPTPTCARCWAGRAKSGARNRAPTG